MAEKLAERNQNVVTIESDIQADGNGGILRLWRIIRIVLCRRHCENALKYAHAKTIRIVARLRGGDFDMKVEDDGAGFDTETSRKLDQMLEHKHFGLANKHERASLIGAEIRIESKVDEGTRVYLSWTSKASI